MFRHYTTVPRDRGGLMRTGYAVTDAHTYGARQLSPATTCFACNKLSKIFLFAVIAVNTSGTFALACRESLPLMAPHQSSI